ncbi:pyridoxamine 5'-phosphate oxidase family protein [Acetobacterium tundrae]|uniref:Pyridoxamine 5'-phosphate oxidase family protein n=2 Tax=Acetobacterium tundrae TaxID=132932 RepID=A0ABR6WJE4_9FIRM|nr:pyridoxamine 5'-phosphate oxidase family protein [Acetobacterium tundrae]
MKMRRKDREVTEKKELMKIIEQCKICRIAMQAQDGLYLVPVNFGYLYINNQLVLYFHSAKEGRKINALKENSEICFEMDCEHRLITGDVACQYGYSFKSIIGNGRVAFVHDVEEKKIAMFELMKHQTGQNFSFDENMVDCVAVLKIIVHQFTGKDHH